MANRAGARNRGGGAGTQRLSVVIDAISQRLHDDRSIRATAAAPRVRKTLHRSGVCLALLPSVRFMSTRTIPSTSGAGVTATPPTPSLLGAPPSAAALVSVVIPCYNQGRFLGDAIESVIVQHYPRVEIIVIDDGATDDTAVVAKSYPAVRYVRQDNQGLAAARNAGLARCHGDFVIFLDADDRLLPNALLAGVRALQANPSCALAFGRHRRVAADGSPLPTVPRPRVDGDHYLELLRRNYIPMPAAATFRRAVFDLERPFDVGVSPSADYDLFLRVARRFPIVDHYDEVAEYRQHGANMTRNTALMLAATLAVVRARRPSRTASPQEWAAWRQAWRNAGFYYERLFGDTRDDLRSRNWRQLARDVALIARYFPVLPGAALHKLATPLRRALAARRACP